MTTTVRALKKSPPMPTVANVVPPADISIHWTLDPEGKRDPRTITGAELAPILEWLYQEANGGQWDRLLGSAGDIPERLMRLADLLANFSTVEQSNDDGADVYELAESMRSLVRRVSVHSPAHASVTIASRGESA